MISIAAEKNFENRLKKFLEDEGCWYIKFFANAYTKSGIPDLICGCNGYFVAVEVKAPKGKPSELQKWNIKKIIEANGIAIVLYPDQFDQFKELIWFVKNNNWYKARQIMHKINERWDK